MEQCVSVTNRPALESIHHVALIVSDYQRSKAFYTELLGLEQIAENYREYNQSWKLDLRLNDGSQLELFHFPQAPERCTEPEALGLRHLSFRVSTLDQWISYLKNHFVKVEEVRVDPYTGKRFTFFQDPDKLPLELYEELHEEG